MITVKTNIFIGRKFFPPGLVLRKFTSPSINVLIWMIFVNFYFLGNLNFPIRFDEFQNFYPRGKILEFYNEYRTIIRCLLLKYLQIFSLVFLHLTELKVRLIL